MRTTSLVLPILTALVVVISAAPVSEFVSVKRSVTANSEYNGANMAGTLSKRAVGKFSYTYTDADGNEHRQELTDVDGTKSLANGMCHEVPEAEAEGTEPAHSPDNNTDENIEVYEESSCTGTVQNLRGGGEGGVNLKFRSYYFPN